MLRLMKSRFAIPVAIPVVAGLILFSAIDSIPNAGARVYRWAPVRLLATNQFDTVTKAAAVAVPVVLVQGHGDRTVPMPVARGLFQQFRGPKVMLETGGGHHHSGFMPGDRADLFEALAWRSDVARVGRLQDDLRSALARLESVAAEAKHERRSRLSNECDPDPLVRTLRRLRNDLLLIARRKRLSAYAAKQRLDFAVGQFRSFDARR